MKTSLSLLSVFFFLFCSFNVVAQVSTDPVVPNAENTVKIIFDASNGSGGLKDCGCDVYIHMGAVTESAESTTWSIVPFQWATTDPKAKMTRVEGEANLYTFELIPNSFFDNPNGLTIYRLGLVFRNGDGTKEGKSSNDGDFS